MKDTNWPTQDDDNNMSLLPQINPTMEERVEVWRRYHANKFWCRYFGTSGNFCPECGSVDYEENERELYVVGQEEPEYVDIWYTCNECDSRWVNDDYMKYDNHE